MERVEYEKLIVQDLINLNKNKELNLTLWYQRRSVWNPSQKSYLINTLFEQTPIPTLYIRHSLDIEAEKSVREVVDGQQRIRAILEYTSDDFAAKHPSYEKKVKCSQLKKSDLEKLKLTALSVGYLLGATDEDVIEIFGRLNSVAKSLNAQEKRNANYSGEYKQFCLKQSSIRLSFWRDLNIFTANAIARMDEVQFMSDLTLNLIKGLSDYSPSRLDAIYKEYDEDFPKASTLALRLDRLFSQLSSLKPEAIRDTVFRRTPLLFSLFIALDSSPKKLPKNVLEEALYSIDQNVNSDTPLSERSKADAEFFTACTSSTQRIKQREVRHKFIRKRLGL